MKPSLTAKIHTSLAALTGLAFSLPLLALIVNGSFMRLTGDDYCYRAISQKVGFWADTFYSYYHVSMYSSNRFALTLIYAISSLFAPQANGVLPGLMIVLWAAALYYALQGLFTLLDLPATRGETLLAALFVEFFSLYYSPALEQVAYWQAAIQAYLVPLALSTLLLGFLFRSPRRPLRLWELGGLLLLAFLAGGFSETSAAFEVGLFGLFLLGVLWGVRQKKSWARAMLASSSVVLAGVLIAMLVLFLSPNNQMRQAGLNLPTPPSLPTLIVQSMYNARVYLSIAARKLTLPHLAAGLFAFVWSGLIFSRRAPGPRPSLRWVVGGLLLSAAVCFALLMTIMAPSEYGQSSYPIGRALLNAQFTLVAGIAVAGALAARWLAPYWPRPEQGARIALTACLLLTGYFPLSQARQQFEQTPRYQRWAAFWDARDAVIRKAAAQNQREIDVVEIDKIIPDVGELSPNPDAFHNNCAEMYYGMDRIRANQPGWDP